MTRRREDIESTQSLSADEHRPTAAAAVHHESQRAMRRAAASKQGPKAAGWSGEQKSGWILGDAYKSALSVSRLLPEVLLSFDSLARPSSPLEASCWTLTDAEVAVEERGRRRGKHGWRRRVAGKLLTGERRDRRRASRQAVVMALS